MNQIKNIAQIKENTSPSFAWMSFEWVGNEPSYYAQIIGPNGKDNFINHQPYNFREIEPGLWYAKRDSEEVLIKTCSQPSKAIITDCYEDGRVFTGDGYLEFCI